jgi:hypothetical protein
MTGVKWGSYLGVAGPSGGIPFCTLHKTIARFYLREALMAYRMKNLYPPGFLPLAVSERYAKDVAEDVEYLLRFGLAACLGEVRHFGCECWVRFDSPFFVRAEKIKVCWEVLKERLGGVSGQSVRAFQGSQREAVYAAWIPVSFWVSILRFLYRAFNPVFWGKPGGSKGDFGGEKWRDAVAELSRLYAAWLRYDVSEMVVHFDTFIDLAHNHGRILDKFDCGGLYLTYLLDAKKRGELVSVRGVLNRVCERRKECMAPGGESNVTVISCRNNGSVEWR